MKRLRHPIRAVREPFGTAGLIVACVALVAALGGTAFAAAKLNSTQKKEVEKIAKKYAGAPGANGAPGAQGPAGKDGSNGGNGAAGTPGESVTVAAASGAECPSGGTKFSNKTGSGKACNGTNGTTGFTETLPSGKTETGTFLASEIAEFSIEGPISFPIPLAAALSSSHVHYVTIEEWKLENGKTPPVQCGNGTAANPEAEEGNLCVYESPLSSPANGAEGEPLILVAGVLTPIPTPGVGTSGGMVLIEGPAASHYLGTWAVTAP